MYITHYVCNLLNWAEASESVKRAIIAQVTATTYMYMIEFYIIHLNKLNSMNVNACLSTKNRKITNKQPHWQYKNIITVSEVILTGIKFGDLPPNRAFINIGGV